MKDYMILIPIAALFLVGLFIALRSGVQAVKQGQVHPHVLRENLSALILRVVGYIAGLFVVQHAIGTPSFLSW